MAYVLICKDKPDHLETRKSNRQAHLDYIADTGVVMFAGPTLTDAGDMDGSIVVLTVEDRSAAESWAENDPYAKAGLFASVDIRAWKKVIG